MPAQRVRRIVDLSRRSDFFLEAPMLDLETLAVLAAEYEAANMPSATADLHKRLEYYREKVDLMAGGVSGVGGAVRYWDT